MKDNKTEYMILGVAFGWSRRKGIDVFIELAKRLDHKYRIVLIGTDDTIEKQLPDNIISIRRTNNQQELAEIYTAADLLVNPTREDNYPTVNMEAIACGTPVLTFDTGGSPEMVDKDTGAIVPCNDVDRIALEIRRICLKKPYNENDCIRKAQSFDKWTKFQEYVELYESVR